MSNLVVDEEKRHLLNAPYKIHSSSKLFIVLLAAVVMLPSLSIDSCLASLPNIGFSLHAQPAATALILSLFMAGFAVGHIIFGPLCDRLGRRPTLLIGCAVFTIAAFGCAIAPAYVSGSAFVFIEIFKLDQRAFGALFALNALGIALGALTTGRLSGTPAKRMISIGLTIGLAASAMLVLLTVVHAITPLSAMPFLMLSTFSIGIATPNVVHGTLEPVPEIAGVASSLFGSARMIAGAISTEVVAFWYNGTPMAMTGAMLLFAASAFGFWLLSLRFLNEGPQAAWQHGVENSFVNH